MGIFPPTIGITTYGRNEDGDFCLPAGYVDIVRHAGGLPLLLPPGEMKVGRILELIDGLILAGGGDIDPALYGGTGHRTIERVNPERDAFEMLLAKEVLNRETPVLGICRGMQILNVASGGTLVEHLPDTFGTVVIHRSENRRPVPHLVNISEGTRLRQYVASPEIPVMSLHHQALGTIDRSWIVSARSSDNVVEGMERPDHPWMLAVLWHPELSGEREDQRGLLRSFIEASAHYKTTKQGT